MAQLDGTGSLTERFSERAVSLKSAAWIAAFQLALSLAWILGSDYVLDQLVHNQVDLTKYQTLKGIAFVVFQALITFYLVRARVVELVSARNDQARIAQDFARSEQLQRLASQATQLGTWQIDWRDKVIYCDDRAARHFGIGAAAPLEHLLQLLHPADRAAAEAGAEALKAQKNTTPAEFRFRNADGSYRWIAINSTAVHDGSGVDVVGTSLDITASKQAQMALQASESLLRTVTDHGEVGLALLDNQRRYTFANASYIRLLGLDPDIVGKDVCQTLAEPAVTASAPLDRAFAGEHFTTEIVQPGSESGQSRHFRVIYHPRADDTGKVQNLIVVVFEITELRRSEAALRASEERFRGIYENALTGIVIVNANGKIDRCNPAFSRLLDFTEDELRGRLFTTMIHPGDANLMTRMGQMLRRGSINAFECEVRVTHKNGTYIWLRQVISKLPSQAGRASEVVALCLDTTAQRAAAAAIQASEQLLKHVMEATGEAIWDWSITDDKLRHNLQWSNLLNLEASFDEHAYNQFLALVHPEDRQRVDDAVRNAIVNDAAYDIEYRIRKLDGTYVWIHGRGKVVERSANGAALRMVGSLVDVTTRKDSEERQVQLLKELSDSESELRRQKLLFQSVFESAPDPLILCDQEGTIINCNPAFDRVFNYKLADLKNATASTLFRHQADWLRTKRYAEESKHFLFDEILPFVRRNGEDFPGRISSSWLLDSAGSTIGYLIIIRDVSVEQSREQALREKQRLEALGRITGGIAHDFNNMLTVISGNLQFLEMGNLDPSLKRYLDEAMRAADMGTRLNKRLTTFARQRTLAAVSVDLNELILSLLDLIKRTLGESIKVNLHLDAEPAIIRIDESEMENAIINLALNARDALPDGGTVTIRTFLRKLTASHDANDGPAPGTYVCMTVADDGVGMTEYVKARAFEPFFTTKGVGQGTGLGLSTIQGFVRQSQGRVTIRSEVSRGTTIDIMLPSSATPAEARAEAPIEVPRPSSSKAARILIVEDHPAVRRVTAARLNLLGYQILEASSAAEALELVKTQAVDLVFSDIVMPGSITGFDLKKHIELRHAGLRVLLTTGFADQGSGFSDDSDHGAILHKPYTQDELARAVAVALGQDLAAAPGEHHMNE